MVRRTGHHRTGPPLPPVTADAAPRRWPRPARRVQPHRQHGRGLPVPQCPHTRPHQRPASPGAGVAARRRQRVRRRQRLRRRRACPTGSGRGDRQLPPWSTGVPRPPRPVGRERGPRLRRLRPDGPAGRPALGTAQHRCLRRRPEPGDARRPVRRIGGHLPPHRLADREGLVPPGDPAERKLHRGRRSDPAHARRGRAEGKRLRDLGRLHGPDDRDGLSAHRARHRAHPPHRYRGLVLVESEHRATRPAAATARGMGRWTSERGPDAERQHPRRVPLLHRSVRGSARRRPADPRLVRRPHPAPARQPCCRGPRHLQRLGVSLPQPGVLRRRHGPAVRLPRTGRQPAVRQPGARLRLRVPRLAGTAVHPGTAHAAGCFPRLRTGLSLPHGRGTAPDARPAAAVRHDDRLLGPLRGHRRPQRARDSALAALHGRRGPHPGADAGPGRTHHRVRGRPPLRVLAALPGPRGAER